MADKRLFLIYAKHNPLPLLCLYALLS